MKYDVNTAAEYIDKLEGERKEKVKKLREIILANIPSAIEESISYGMISYCVPHSIYPKGYHVDSNVPLPYLSLASQKNHIAIYPFEIYINDDLKNWFIEEYNKFSSRKLDMGKSCIRFKDNTEIPYDLIAKMLKKNNIRDYIKLYESTFKRKS